jgi:hypothetical protein
MMGELDRYDDAMLDERQYGDDVDARLAADRALEERDGREGRGGRRGRDIAGIAGESESDGQSSERFRERRKRQRRLEEQATAERTDEEEVRTALAVLHAARRADGAPSGSVPLLSTRRTN